MDHRPLVTLGIVTSDGGPHLTETIESCLHQSYEPVEVLLVAYGSAPNPGLDELTAVYRTDDRFRYLRDTPVEGSAGAYNLIASEAAGELIAIVADGDVCLPDRLARQLGVFDRDPELGVVHGDALVIDACGQVTAEWRSSGFNQAQLIRSFYRGPELPDRLNDDRPSPGLRGLGWIQRAVRYRAGAGVLATRRGSFPLLPLRWRPPRAS